MKLLDLRSDTVTKPTAAMRNAIATAAVGDDVYGEDPTVRQLEQRMCELFEKEAALFVPTGVMGNQLCLKAQTQPGDEVIVDSESHIFHYETAAPAVLSGLQLYPAVLPLELFAMVRAVADEYQLFVHCDGARIWNASVATGIPVSHYARYCDSLSVCFSKGLGAPVGSMLLGSKTMVQRAHKWRKVWGGGMRQVGILAAAALYALEHHIERLEQDHRNAKRFAEQLCSIWHRSSSLLLHLLPDVGKKEYCSMRFEKILFGRSFTWILLPAM